MRTTLTISTESRNYTVQGETDKIDALFDRLVGETFKPVPATIGVDLAKGHDMTSTPHRGKPLSEDPLRGRSAIPTRAVVHEVKENKEDVASATETPKKEEPVAEEPKAPDKEEAVFPAPAPATPVKVDEPPVPATPQKYHGFLMIKCEHCGTVKGFNSKMDIDTFRCDCGGRTPLANLVPLTAMCECGKHWRYLTNMTQDTYELNCIHCGSPIPVFWNDKKRKYETVLENLPVDHSKKGGKK